MICDDENKLRRARGRIRELARGLEAALTVFAPDDPWRLPIAQLLTLLDEEIGEFRRNGNVQALRLATYHLLTIAEITERVRSRTAKSANREQTENGAR